MSYSQQVREDARKAADYIREHGWCQGRMFGFDGSCCANGAFIKSIGDDEYTRLIAFQKALCKEANIDSIVEWNDAKGRTKEEVLSVFDRIANS